MLVKNLRKILCILGIIIACTTILAAAGRIAARVHKTGTAQYVFLGDSIYGNYRGDTSISGYFGTKADVTTLNVGMGGTTASLMRDNPRSEISEDSVSLVTVAEAIRSGDYTLLHSSMATRRNGALTYFPQVIKDLEATDLSGTEVFIIEHALNDFFYKRPVFERDGDESSYDLLSYYGAISYSIELIKEKYPEAKILLISPVYGQEDLSDYCKAAEKIAEEQGIYYFDAFNAGIVTPDNYLEVTEDGIHLNEIGREMYADSLYNYCVSVGLL